MSDKMKLILTVAVAVALAGAAYYFRDYNFSGYISAMESAKVKLQEFKEFIESLFTYVKPWYDWVQSWFSKAS